MRSPLLAGSLAVGLLAALAALPSPRANSAGAGDAPVPVLVELFTSEGCSSCPPADALLQKLDRTQPVTGATAIVLSEHVDYWNDSHWKDPFSSSVYTARQNDYARRFRLEASYTPQMVVDGIKELIGSDESDANHAIGNATKSIKSPVTLSAIHLDEKQTLSVRIDVGAPDASGKHSPAQVLLALADDSDQSVVRGGENGGRVLTHVAVVRNLTQVGTTDRGGVFSKDVKVNIEKANPQNLRVVAIIQESGLGRVLGLASAKLAN